MSLRHLHNSPGEACDDGNRLDGDGCGPDCGVEGGWSCEGEPSVCWNLCGNGQVDPGEECDGSDLNGRTCELLGQGYTGGQLGCLGSCVFDTANCALPTCGNQVVDAGEECDDGNTSNEDDCLNNCRINTCGDGHPWQGHEECDDGNLSNEDDCLTSCTNAACGDGHVWQGHEECDDHNALDGDGCSAGCLLENLPVLHHVSDLQAGWSAWTITYANEPHAPDQPVVTAANVEARDQAYVLTQATFHLLSLSSFQWQENGFLSARFTGLPGSSVTAAYGLPGSPTSYFTFIAGFDAVCHCGALTGADGASVKQCYGGLRARR